MEHLPDIDKLDERQQQALTYLLEAPNVSRAIEWSGIPRSTMYRYLNDPTFNAVYKAARRQALSHATGQLQATASDHVDTLLEVSRSPAVPASSRVAAAKAALDLAYKATDIEALEDRIAEIEEVLNRGK